LKAQDYIIKGQLIDYQTLTPLKNISIGFNEFNLGVTDKNGRFEIIANESDLTDTLKIPMLHYYTIGIINLPRTSRTIDLGTIPLFEYFTGHDMTTFNCGWFDFKCKKNAKKHWKKEAKRRSDYFNRMDVIIDYYRFVFRNSSYKIEDHLLDLSKPKID